MIVAFGLEEEVEAFGEKLTLRLSFKEITIIEGALGVNMPTAAAHIRCGSPSYNELTQVLWAMTREHNDHLTHNQILTIVMDATPEGAKVGFALDALIERAFPLQVEDKKPKNGQRRSGRSKSSGASGSQPGSSPTHSGEKVHEPS